MRNMLLRMFAVAALAVWGMAASAEPPVSVNLSISHAKGSVSKTGDSKPKRTGRHGTSSATEVKNSTFEYSGKVGCNVPKDKTVKVTLEAYFITRSIGTKGATDEVGKRTVIDTYEFGGENPNSYVYSLVSPAISQTTVTTVKTTGGRGRHRRGGYSTSTDKQKSGTRLMGVIVRAMVDGKPVKVVSEPGNTRWVAAGKKDVVTLE